MSSILYARSVLSPKSMLVWLMMAELPRSGVSLPEDDTMLARLCMTTPKGLAKARAEIAAAGLDNDVTAVPSVSPSRGSSTDRVRRYRERKALQGNVTTVTDETLQPLHDDVSSVSSGVSYPVSSVPRAHTGAHAGADNYNNINNILELHTESESDNTYTDDTPNQIHGDFCEKSPCVSESVSSSLAEPETQPDEIIPPDPSALRSAVSGMFGGVSVSVMSDTPVESEITGTVIAGTATTESTDAENSSRSATPVQACRAGAGTAQPHSQQDGLDVSATDNQERGNRPLPGRSGRQDTLTATAEKPSGRVKRDYSDGFTTFWGQYPTRKGHDKSSAYARYAATLKITTHDEIMRQLRGYLAHLADNPWKQPQHPATWLNKTFVKNADEPLDWTAPDPVPVGGDAGHSLIGSGKRANFDPVEAAYQAEMAEIAERERRESHVH